MRKRDTAEFGWAKRKMVAGESAVRKKFTVLGVTKENRKAKGGGGAEENNTIEERGKGYTLKKEIIPNSGVRRQ